MTGRLARLARMGPAEVTWRGAAATRIAFDRALAAARPPRWDRRALRSALAPHIELAGARAALAAGRWDDAQGELSRHFAAAPQRFVISRTMRDSLADRIREEFPDSPREAAARADRILAGNYDLLGYRSLQFEYGAESTQRTQRENDPERHLPLCPSRPLCQPRAAEIDWHLDPVHNRRAPRSFWSTVPYLDPAYGDHKIIWELNRHQHWIALGRAYWLTGDPKYRERVLAELASWIEANPPLTGANWASMLELGFRSLSWIWALHFFVEGPAEAGRHRDRPWIVDLLLAIDRQLTHVERNLSHYFSPNTHLLGEALALYVSGRVLPELSASARREAIGRRVLVAEMARQIAADGGHCERSTAYHRYTLDFYLLALAIARITGDPIAADFEPAVDRLARAARLLADDNGRLPHIGDDDAGKLLPMTEREPDDARDSLATAAALLDRPELQIGPAPEETLWMLADARLKPRAPFQRTDVGAELAPPPGAGQGRPLRPRIPSAALPDTGYYVSRSPDGNHLVIDGGPHGYQNGGHAHADALSLTFTTRGIPLLIDPGTGSYTTDRELRDRMRSSAMHNTVTIDGRPQSVPNGPFHWTHTANGHVHRWRTQSGVDYFDGSHDGYAPIDHRRRLVSVHGDVLVIADFVGDGNGADGGNGITQRSRETERCVSPFHRLSVLNRYLRPLRFLVDAKDDSSQATTTRSAAVHWHLDPRWIVEVNGRRVTFSEATAEPAKLAETNVSARSANSAVAPIRITLLVPQGMVEAFHGDEQTGLGWWSPTYGRLERTTTVRVSREATGPFWMASVFDLDAGNPIADVEWLPVWAEAGTIAHAAALRLARAESTDYVLFAEPSTTHQTKSVGAELAPPAGADQGRPLHVTPKPAWRVGEIETDARMLCCRVDRDRRATCLAFVDGTFARYANSELRTQNRESLTLNPEPRTPNPEPRTEGAASCAASRGL